MKFPYNLYVAAFAAGILTSILSLPFWKKVCARFGVVDDPGHRKIHHTTIPLAGGLAVFTGLAVPIIAAALAVHFNLLHLPAGEALAYGLNRRAIQLAAICLGGAAMLLLGLADDRWELKAGPKFLCQLLIALGVAASGVRITLFVPSIPFSYFVTVLWILTVTNAFNFIDNMNGLCSGLALIASWQFAVIAAASGQYLVAMFAFLIGGSVLGFLPFNFPRATAFLGDSGSHLLGFLLSVLGILPHFYTGSTPRPFAVLIPLFVLAVPLADLLSVVIWRWRMGKPVYIGDTNHLSHRLVRAGLKPTQAVIFIWAMAALAGLLALRV